MEQSDATKSPQPNAISEKVFWMIWLMGRQKSGISMFSLQRMLEIKTYKTVWTMGHKIRQAMAKRDANYKLAGLIEMDDTYFGAPKPSKQRRGAAGKAKVVVAVETSADKPRFAAMCLVPRLSHKGDPGYNDSHQLTGVRKILLGSIQESNILHVERLSSGEYDPFHGIVFEGNDPYAKVQIKEKSGPQNMTTIPHAEEVAARKVTLALFPFHDYGATGGGGRGHKVFKG